MLEHNLNEQQLQVQRPGFTHQVTEEHREQFNAMDANERLNYKKEQALKLEQRADWREMNLSRHLTGVVSLDKFKIKTAPDKTSLVSFYTGIRKNLTARERAAKIQNSRSRLFKKAANSTALKEASRKAASESYERAEKAADSISAGLSMDKIRDLSYFCVSDNAEENKQLIKLYTGVGIDHQDSFDENISKKRTDTRLLIR